MMAMFKYTVFRTSDMKNRENIVKIHKGKEMIPASDSLSLRLQGCDEVVEIVFVGVLGIVP